MEPLPESSAPQVDAKPEVPPEPAPTAEPAAAALPARDCATLTLHFVSGGRVVVDDGERMESYSLASGERLWERELSKTGPLEEVVGDFAVFGKGGQGPERHSPEIVSLADGRSLGSFEERPFLSPGASFFSLVEYAESEPYERLSVYSLPSLELALQLGAPEGAVYFDPKERLLAIVDEKTARFETLPGKYPRQVPTVGPRFPVDDDSNAIGASFTENGRFFAWTLEDRRQYLRDLERGVTMPVHKACQLGELGFVASHDGRLLGGSTGTEPCLVNASSGKVIYAPKRRTAEEMPRAFAAQAFTRDGAGLFGTWGFFGTRLMDVKSRQFVELPEFGEGGLAEWYAFTGTLHGDLLVPFNVSGGLTAVMILRPGLALELRALPAPFDHVEAVYPDGSLLLSREITSGETDLWMVDPDLNGAHRLGIARTRLGLGVGPDHVVFTTEDALVAHRVSQRGEVVSLFRCQPSH